MKSQPFITQLAEWQALQAHQQQVSTQRMQDWFAEDSLRFSRFSLQAGGILLDYSKNHITQKTIPLLCNLAQAADLSAKIEALLTGQPVNITEHRPALHIALRSELTTPIVVNGENIVPVIQETLARMRQFSAAVRHHIWRGSTGKPITDIVNIGIGGSHLGPLLTTHALADFADKTLRCHFVSNIDPDHVYAVLDQINPETTLFIISSKSFTTLETLTNAQTVKNWLQQKIGAVEKHFVAVTANIKLAIAFGIPRDQVFPVWDWVGGRYSIWSAIGLPLALLIGMDHFTAFLRGAHEMDQHFRHTPFSMNMPVLMALLGIWNINFFSAHSHAIVPYSHRLMHLRAYLQQLDMESNGKAISLAGHPIHYATGPVIFGEQGCNAQHAFHQLLHQGQQFIPVDFILAGKNNSEQDECADILIASGLSQSQALMQGKSYQQAFAELIAAGHAEAEASTLAQHKVIPGNRPSNTLFLNQVNPHNLGALLALYEHKIFVQGALWNINSFDQWGVELGKQLLLQILTEVQSQDSETRQDSSTQGLIQHYKNLFRKESF